MSNYTAIQPMRSLPLPMDEIRQRPISGKKGRSSGRGKTAAPVGWTEAEWDAHLVRLAELATERKELREPPSAAA